MKKLFVYFILSAFFAVPSISAVSSEFSSVMTEEVGLQEKKEIQKEDLPEAVQKALQEDRFTNYSISKIYEVTTQGAKHYSVVFEYGGGQTTTINFDKSGKIIE